MTTFEKLGIEYEERDGLLYPLLSVNLHTAEITKAGKYGRMWMNFMKENYPQRYRTLQRFGKLSELAEMVNEEAYEFMDAAEEKYLRKHKAGNSFMEQLHLRNQIRMVTEETVLQEIVLRYR